MSTLVRRRSHLSMFFSSPGSGGLLRTGEDLGRRVRLVLRFSTGLSRWTEDVRGAIGAPEKQELGARSPPPGPRWRTSVEDDVEMPHACTDPVR